MMQSMNSLLRSHKRKKPLKGAFNVPEAGLEPARSEEHKILSLACLPIPPLRLQLHGSCNVVNDSKLKKRD